jgi:hypothetical protein
MALACPIWAPQFKSSPQSCQGGDGEGVTPGFKAKSNAHSMCVQESSLHSYDTKNGYRITNVTIYNIYYRIMSYKRLNRSLSKTQQQNDTITPQAIDRW